MLNEKIRLTKALKQFIRDTRKEHNLLLIDLENKSKFKHKTAWFSQVEGERTKTIKRDDIIDIFKIMLDTSEEKAELYVESFLNNKADEFVDEALDNEDETLESFNIELNELINCLKEIYNNSNKDSKLILLKSLKTLKLNYCSNSQVTTAFTSLPLHAIFQISNVNSNKILINSLQELIQNHLTYLIAENISFNTNPVEDVKTE